MPPPRSRPRTLRSAVALAVILGVVPAPTRAHGDHLVINEIATGGASANDEFIELFNPTAGPLSLANLEIAYVSSSGTTVSRRTAWGGTAPDVPGGGHVLLANEAGVHAAAADVLYAGGLAATGGTVILRAAGAAVAIDAAAWGTATGAWVEGAAALAPGPGFSIERVTDPSDGHVRDTNQNATDFVLREVPTPRGSQPMPSATPTPAHQPAATELVMPTPTASPTPSEGPGTVSIANARAAANGTSVTVEGTALTGSAFHDGGGYLADGFAGIAVIVEDGGFAGGSRLRVTGMVDDRFAQRTIRSRQADIQVLGEGAEIDPVDVSTGSIGEALEGRLARISAVVRGSPTVLTTGVAFDVDDGRGSVRVLIATATGVETAAWTPGASVDLVGVVGQRDSSGTGSSGYRILPRSPADVTRVAAAPTQSPTPTSATPSRSPDATPAPSLVSPISAARAAATGTHLTIRGVVTMALGVVDPETAVVQDDTGAIVLRMDAEAGPISVGDVIEVSGVRSTKSGMETLRATSRLVLGSAAAAPMTVPIAGVSEEIEARLVLVTGRLLASARRASSGTVSFDLTDGGATVRVVMPASLGTDDSTLVAGASVEVVGIVGQETTAADPLAGYRIWPRSAAEVRVLASVLEEPGGPSAGPRGGAAGTSESGRSRVAETPRSGTPNSLEGVGLADLRVGATLVVGAWPEMAIGGLLWDGERLVAISAAFAPQVAAFGRPPPVPLAMHGMRVIGVEPRTGVPLVALGSGRDAMTVTSGAPAAPRTTVPRAGDSPGWVTLIGRLHRNGSGLQLEVEDGAVRVEIACSDPRAAANGMFSVTGISVGDPPRIIVPCDGLRVAPTLARVALSAPAVATGPEIAAGANGGRDPVPANPRRPLAIWLVVLAALVVAWAALVWRRLEGEPRLAGDAQSDDGPRVAEVPPLTLVRLRRRDRS